MERDPPFLDGFASIAASCVYTIDKFFNSVKIRFKKNGVRKNPAFPNHLIERPPFQRRFIGIVHNCDSGKSQTLSDLFALKPVPQRQPDIRRPDHLPFERGIQFPENGDELIEVPAVPSSLRMR